MGASVLINAGWYKVEKDNLSAAAAARTGSATAYMTKQIFFDKFEEWGFVQVQAPWCLPRTHCDKLSALTNNRESRKYLQRVLLLTLYTDLSIGAPDEHPQLGFGLRKI
ncbi:hypothetical protein [Novosphingobium sp. HII-3]|uniref:hypothetical protein n=1 Tax=Novosphingobium sp. HII-3 TaxID=2075565 RepID=UPI0011AEDDC5|nr:hypothetical protein [Novosphingobium sp. HII-3]